MDIGDRIKQLRTERGWRQEDLGQRAGVNKQLISRYELHIAKPTFDILVNIAKAFGITLDYLVHGQTAEERINDLELLKLSREADNLSHENKELAKGFLQAILAKEKLEIT